MRKIITLHEDGSGSITWEAETDEEGVELKNALLDALNERALRADEPNGYEPEDDSDREALFGSCADEADWAGGA